MPRSKKRKTQTLSSSSVTSGVRLSDQDKQNVEELLAKQFLYSPIDVSAFGAKSDCGTIVLEDIIGDEPRFVSSVWQDDDLMALKKELNQVKDKLSGQDIEIWHAHTTNSNLAARLIPHVKSLGVELCTQAWLKFYEIVSTHRALTPACDFLSVHLCEAPGAFITSLNHYLQYNKFPYEWDWLATTLNPYCETNSLGSMVADDRLIRHTHSKWYFGHDGTGDIMKEGHVEGLSVRVARVKKQNCNMPVLLITADGSRDCQSNPAEQEALVSRLHYCEALTACILLEQGGNLLIKLFTMLESSSILLMFLLNLMFHQVHVIKPASSKSGNSENYVVCLNYRANVKEGTLWKLLKQTVYSDQSLLLSLPSLPPSFLADHRRCCHMFAHWQKETIRTNLELYTRGDNPVSRAMLRVMQGQVLEKFVAKTGLCLPACCHVSRLCPLLKQVSSFQLQAPPSVQYGSPHSWGPRCLRQGTFELRQHLQHMSFSQRLGLIKSYNLPEPKLLLLNTSGVIQEREWSPPELSTLSDQVNNSRFCDADIFGDFTTIWSQPHVVKSVTDRTSHSSDLAQWFVEVVTSLPDKKANSQLQAEVENLLLSLPDKKANSQLQAEVESLLLPSTVCGHPHEITSVPSPMIHEKMKLENLVAPSRESSQTKDVLQNNGSPLTENLTLPSSDSRRPTVINEASEISVDNSKAGNVLLPLIGHTRDMSNTSSDVLKDNPAIESKQSRKVSGSSREDLHKKTRLCVCFQTSKDEGKNECDSPSERMTQFLSLVNKDDRVCLGCVTDLQGLTSVCEVAEPSGIFVFSDMTTYFDDSVKRSSPPLLEEVCVRRIFLSRMLSLLKSLHPGSGLILLTSTFLTRLTAGYLCVLARCFRQSSIRSWANPWLHQFVVLEDFLGQGQLDHLSILEGRMVQEEGHTDHCVTSLMDTPHLLAERKFVQFVSAHNNFVLANFVDLVLEEYRQESTDQSTD